MNILKLKLNARNLLLNYTKIVCNAGSKFLPTFLLTFLILFQPVSALFAQRISSGCTSNNSLDVRVEGIHNRSGSFNVKGMGSKVKKVIAECTCRGRIKMNLKSTCPEKIDYTVNGQNVPIYRTKVSKYSNWWGNNAGEYEGDFYVYRLIQNKQVTSLKYNAPAKASDRAGMRGLTTLIVNNDAANANQPQSLFIDNFIYQYAPRCYNFPIEAALTARDITLYFAVSEIGKYSSSKITRYSLEAYDANGKLVANKKQQQFSGANFGDEIRLDKIVYNNVPANATYLKVCIESPDPDETGIHGTSFMIGSIAVTSKQNKPTLTCPANKTVACAKDITPGKATYKAACPDDNRTLSVTGPVIHGEPDCPGTTYTYTHKVGGLSCEQVFTIGNDAAPTITTNANAVVVCEADIIPVFPHYSANCAENAAEHISGPVVKGSPGCAGTTYTYTYTITDACGRSASSNQVFEIGNNAGPTITCNTHIQVVCEKDIKLVFPAYTTNCGGHAIESACGPVISGTPGGVDAIYTYMYTVTDACGRSASCEQVFKIGNDCNKPSPCNLTDWQALKTIYETTNGENWILQKGWEQIKSHEPPPDCNLANMSGVTLDRNTNRVVDLYLFSLKGEFPKAVLDLTELQYLYLFSSDFMGSSIPARIANLEKLKELVLNNANIGGHLPPELTTLTNLMLLAIQDNNLSGSYPSGFTAFCNQLTHHRFQCNASISDGNNFDMDWESFCTTGVCKNYKRAIFNDYTIHPNPSTGKVLIEFEKESRHNREIHVYDSSGKQYESISYKGIDNSIELDLSQLPKGIYIVEVQNNFSTTTEKLILQ